MKIQNILNQGYEKITDEPAYIRPGKENLEIYHKQSLGGRTFVWTVNKETKKCTLEFYKKLNSAGFIEFIYETTLED